MSPSRETAAELRRADEEEYADERVAAGCDHHLPITPTDELREFMRGVYARRAAEAAASARGEKDTPYE